MPPPSRFSDRGFCSFGSMAWPRLNPRLVELKPDAAPLIRLLKPAVSLRWLPDLPGTVSCVKSLFAFLEVEVLGAAARTPVKV